MKKSLIVISVFLFISCEKENKHLFGTWDVYETQKRDINWNWEIATNDYKDCIIGRNKWEPYIIGKCEIENGVITPKSKELNGGSFTYEYNSSTDEIIFNRFSVYGEKIFIHKLKRID